MSNWQILPTEQGKPEITKIGMPNKMKNEIIKTLLDKERKLEEFLNSTKAKLPIFKLSVSFKRLNCCSL